MPRGAADGGRSGLQGLVKPAARLALLVCYALGRLCAQPRAGTELELSYQPNLVALGFPSPVLRGTMNGVSAWFLIDTGASVHTLASWFAAGARIETQAGPMVKGSTGKGTPVRVIHGEIIRLENGPGAIQLKEAIVVDFPKIFEEQKIGGLISPQLLAPPNAATALDLRVPRLSFERQAEPSAGLRVCRNPESQFENRLYSTTVRVGNLPGSMLVDTGATSSFATPESAIGKALLSRARVTGRAQGVGGEATQTRQVPGTRLSFAGVQANVSLTIGGAASNCGSDGLVGMDALRSCRLVLGEMTLGIACR